MISMTLVLRFHVIIISKLNEGAYKSEYKKEVPEIGLCLFNVLADPKSYQSQL
jgi:hypothetical protein